MDTQMQEDLIDLSNGIEALQERIQNRIDDPDIGIEAKNVYDLLGTIHQGLDRLLTDPRYAAPQLLPQVRSQFQRFAQTVFLVEKYTIPSFAGYDDVSRRVTRIVRELGQQVHWPIRTPMISADSPEYWVTLPSFNLMRVPARLNREIRSLPDAIHEMTHLLVEDPKYKPILLGDFNKVVGEYFINQPGPMRVSTGMIDTWRDAWVAEFVGDMVAAYVTGPVVPDQWMRFSRELGLPAFQVSQGASHPPNDARVRGTVAVMQSMGRNAEAQTVLQQWQEYLAKTGQRPDQGYNIVVPDVLVNALAQRVVDGCRQIGIRGYDLATTQPNDIVGVISQAWQKFHADPKGYGVWERDTLRGLWKFIRVPLATVRKVAAPVVQPATPVVEPAMSELAA